MTIINGNYKENKLDNGLVVALQNTPTQTIASKFRINFGSYHEEKGEEGMAHFLEHCLCTSGSEKYTPIQADKIRRSFGFFNATTTIGRTFLVGQMLTEEFENWLDYLSSQIFHPRFDVERVEGERKRVLREIADNKSSFIYEIDKAIDKVFYRGHPKQISTLGNEEVIKNVTISKLKEFYSCGFHPNNIEFIAAGGLPENSEELVKKYFGIAPKGNETRVKFPELKPLEEKAIFHRYAPERCNSENPQESSGQLFLMTACPGDGHPDEYAIRAMSLLLGGDTNSFLYQNIGLKKGLAYNVSSSYNGFYNCGELKINADIPAIKIDESVDAIFEEIERIKNKKVSEFEVERIKKIAKYNIAKSFETNEGHISAIELKLDEGFTPETHLRKYDEVTPEKIQYVANKYLPDKENGKYILYIGDPLKQKEVLTEMS